LGQIVFPFHLARMELGFWESGHALSLEWGSEFLSLLRGVGQGGATIDADFPDWPWVMFLELSVTQFLLTYIFRQGLVEPLSKVILYRHAVRPRMVSKSRIIKFSQSVAEATTYAAFFFMGYRVVRRQPWIWPSREWWTEQPSSAILTKGAAFFYVTYAARYTGGIVYTVWLEPKRKDYNEMIIHHVVSLALVYLSFIGGMAKIGLVVMLLFDPVDTPLHVAKCLNYIKEVKGKETGIFTFSNMADACFAFFALAFTLTRMVMYPYVCWSAFSELTEVVAGEEEFHWSEYFKFLPLPVAVCHSLLIVLLALQAFWFRLLIIAIAKAINGNLKDSRSDSESQSDYDTDSDKKKVQ